jgi:hypothetical protein
VYAARTHKHDSEVIEEALRDRDLLGMTALDEARRLSTLTEDEALAIANEELHSYRRERSSH